MPERKTTCGPLFKAALDRYTTEGPFYDEDAYRAFIGGWCNSACEKVYLGACRAAMFRPSAGRRELLLEVARDACLRYGLRLELLNDEVWVLRDETASIAFDGLRRLEVNSGPWHTLRGMLTGIPLSEIDGKFHERPGASEDCD